MTPHCADPWCRDCVEREVDAGLLKPRDEAAPAVTDRDVALMLEEADAEIARAEEDGTDAYVQVRGSSEVERRAHNSVVAGSSPAPATASQED